MGSDCHKAARNILERAGWTCTPPPPAPDPLASGWRSAARSKSATQLANMAAVLESRGWTCAPPNPPLPPLTGDWDWAQCQLRAGRAVVRSICEGAERTLHPNTSRNVLVTDITATDWRLA